MDLSLLIQRLNGAMSIAQMGIYEWNIQTNQVTWTDPVFDLFEIPRGDLNGIADAWHKRVHPEDMDRINQELDLALNGKRDYNTSFRIVKKNGSIAHVRAVGYIERDEKGAPTRMTGMNWDITSEVTQQEENRIQREFYENLFQAAPDPIYLINENYDVFYANRAFFEFLGKPITLEEFSNQYREEIRKRHEAGFRSTSNVEREEYLTLPTGRKAVVLMKRTPSTFLDGKRVVISTIRDISERKQMEEQLEVVRAQQLNASKLAALGEMAGGVAHEINNPLAVVDGKIQLLQRMFQSNTPPSPEVTLGHLTRAREYLERIASIVRGIKNVSRAADRDPYMPFSVKDAILDSLGICSEKFRTEGVKIDLTIPPNIDPRSIGRTTQISQIFLNLLNNAYDAVLNEPNKKIEIMIEDGSQTWKIHVLDSGRGIPQSIRSKIMQPFFTTKEREKGTGLGLSISHSIAEMHSGRLYLNTEFNKTCFTLELPKYDRSQERWI